jgi:hypothetical protein
MVERLNYSASYQDLTHGQKSVGATATSLVGTNENRRSAIIQNQGSFNLFVGNSGVATNNTILLGNLDNLTLYSKGKIYGVCPSGTSTIAWLETKD